METPHRNPFEELNDLLHRLPAGTGEELASKLAIQIKRDYAPELETEHNEAWPRDIQEFLDDLVIDEEVSRKWDETLNSPESAALLEKMAAKAREERKKGRVYTIEDLEKVLEANLAKEGGNAQV